MPEMQPDLCECERDKAAVLEHEAGIDREYAEELAQSQALIRHCEDWPTCRIKELGR